jgi:hypothetical protein
MGPGYPDEEGREVVDVVASFASTAGVAAVAVALLVGDEGLTVEEAAVEDSAFSFPIASFPAPSKLRDWVSYLGVMSPPLPFIMPRPGIMGVLRELWEALPLTPKGNLGSQAPDKELEEVLGRVMEVPNEPQPFPWLLWP